MIKRKKQRDPNLPKVDSIFINWEAAISYFHRFGLYMNTWGLARDKISLFRSEGGIVLSTSLSNPDLSEAEILRIMKEEMGLITYGSSVRANNKIVYYFDTDYIKKDPHD